MKELLLVVLLGFLGINAVYAIDYIEEENQEFTALCMEINGVVGADGTCDITHADFDKIEAYSLEIACDGEDDICELPETDEN